MPIPQLTGPVLAAAQGVYTSSSTQLHGIGEYVVTNDGRGYRYCKAGGTALVVGKIQQAKAEDTSNEQELTITNAAVDDTTIVTTDTVTLALNLLAGGFLIVSEGTLGVGQTYKLKGNTAATAAVVTFNLDEPVRVATTGTAKVDVKVNPYMSVIVAPTSPTSAIVGAAQYAITASEFGWLQTRGVCAILAQGTVVVGDGLVPANTTTTGTVVSRADASLEASIGYALHGAATTDYVMAYLTIS
jgi:hypothetical protein